MYSSRVGHNERMMLLVPGDVLRPRRPDEHYATEAAAAGEVAVVDHDALPGLDAAGEPLPDDGRGDGQARGHLGAAVLRDYTKSMKHYWHDAAYIPDTEDADVAWRVATRLRELRDDEFTTSPRRTST
jgi:ATP-grasp domain-containing protein